MPPSPLRGARSWQPVGSAFAASALLHALAIVALGFVVVQPVAAPKTAPLALQAVIVRSPAPDKDAAAPQAPPPAAVAKAEALRPALPRATPEPAAPAPPVSGALPWAGTAVDTSPPQGFWSRPQPRVEAGVEVYEDRNVTQLGEQVLRRIQSGYPVEPAQPIRLRRPEVIGYPLEALDAGVEGRVFVWVGVNEEGKVTDVELLDGPPELSDWVVARIGRLIERPALDRKGEPVPGWVALDFAFSREAALAARAAQDAAALAERAGQAERSAKTRGAR